MTIRDFRKIEGLQPNQMFLVQTKRHAGQDYPIDGRVLPVVYANERFDKDTLVNTVRAGTREDFVWVNRYQAEGSKLYAYRINGQLYAIENSLPYSVRGYDLDGNILWSQDYWSGVLGAAPSSGLSIAVDAEGNSYVSGPCAHGFDGSYWSLISYDKDGFERWRKDLRTAGRALNPSYSSYTGNMYDVCCTDDQRIMVLGDAWSIATAGSPEGFSTWTFFPDGSSAPTPDLTYRGTIHSKLLAVGNRVAVLPLAYGNYPGFSSDAACRSGQTNQYFVDTGIAGAFGQSGGPHLVRLPAFDPWTFSAEWTYTFNTMWASQNIGQRISTVVTSDDGTEIYCSAVSIHAILNGVGKTGNVVRLTSTPTTASQPSGEGQAPVFPGPDSILWSSNTPVKAASVAHPRGVVMGGTGAPRLQLYSKADGSKIWAHNHFMVTSLDKRGSLIVAAGVRQRLSADVSFV